MAENPSPGRGSAACQSTKADRAISDLSNCRATKSHLGSDSFFDQPPITTPLTVSESPGETIGNYKLLQQIGEGGFGVVFMAEQSQPVRRKVALGILSAWTLFESDRRDRLLKRYILRNRALERALKQRSGP